jgi:hypothetical protein
MSQFNFYSGMSPQGSSSQPPAGSGFQQGSQQHFLLPASTTPSAYHSPERHVLSQQPSAAPSPPPPVRRPSTPPRDIQQELEEAREWGLVLKAGQEAGIKKKGKWARKEREALLGWLSEGENYRRVKTKGKSVWKDLAQHNGLFQGTRSWNGIKSQWEDLKKKYDAASERVNSTGEGDKSESQWTSMENGKFLG